MIDYIRCYDITVDKIKEHKTQIISYLNQLSKKELGSYKIDDYERFLNHLVNVYQDYEVFKQDKGYYDYSDMLYLFIKEHEHTVFDYDYVFVDELQDANILEAKVARIAANKFNKEHHTRFYLVGDVRDEYDNVLNPFLNLSVINCLIHSFLSTLNALTVLTKLSISLLLLR